MPLPTRWTHWWMWWGLRIVGEIPLVPRFEVKRKFQPVREGHSNYLYITMYFKPS